MTRVFVVTFGWDYEGEVVRGVFSSEEKARAAIAKDDTRYGDSTHIYEMEVDVSLACEEKEI